MTKLAVYRVKRHTAAIPQAGQHGRAKRDPGDALVPMWLRGQLSGHVAFRVAGRGDEANNEGV